MLDNDGEYAVDNEIWNKKYTDTIRLCVGVAKCELQSGKIVGRCTYNFDYSGKGILSSKDFIAWMKQEIDRVRIHQGGTNWIDNTCEKAALNSASKTNNIKSAWNT